MPLCGAHRRRHACVTAEVDVGSFVDQKPARLEMIVIGGRPQRRHAEPIESVDVSTLLDQARAAVRVAGSCRFNKALVQIGYALCTPSGISIH